MRLSIKSKVEDLIKEKVVGVTPLSVKGSQSHFIIEIQRGKKGLFPYPAFNDNRVVEFVCLTHRCRLETK